MHIHAQYAYRTENIEKKSLVDQNLLLSNRISDRIFDMYLSKHCDFSESVLKPRACVPEHGLGILRSASKAAFYMRAHRDPRAQRGQQRKQRPTEATEPHRVAHRVPAEAQVCKLCVFMCFHAYAI